MTRRLRATLLLAALGAGLALLLPWLLHRLGLLDVPARLQDQSALLPWIVGTSAIVAGIALVLTALLAWRLLNVGAGPRVSVAATEGDQAFLGRVSHELRRPLAALRGELELAVRRPREAPVLRAAIARSLEDAERMSRLVDDLLFHARSRAGRLTLVRADVDLVDFVYAAVDRTQRALARAPASLRVAAIPDVVVHIDAERLSQALENLIANAHAHGGAHADVTVRGERVDGGIALHVEDDGPGVPRELQEDIFAPFGRGDVAPAQGGTGLGLAIARDVVEAHGGTLTLTSPRAGRDRGACFTIHLPASCCAAR